MTDRDRDRIVVPEVDAQPVDPLVPMPVVIELLAIETLCDCSRRAIALWSDGTLGEALRWFEDEMLVCEGDLIGSTEGQILDLAGVRLGFP